MATLMMRCLLACAWRYATMALSRTRKQHTRPRLSAEARGYGSAHRAERERRLSIYRPGDICAHGGETLRWWPVQIARRYLDLPHNADRTGYLPGLSCRRHNRADGAIRGNRARGRSRAWASARRW